MKVVAFNGSPRRNGNTKKVMDVVLGILEEQGIVTELIHIDNEGLSNCTGCMQCYHRRNKQCVLTDKLNSYIAKIEEADGLLLGSPTYFADVTISMKTFIDRVGTVAKANGNLFSRKVGASVATAGKAGAMIALNTMNNFFLVEDMIVPGNHYWNVAIGGGRNDVNQDLRGIENMQRLGHNIAWLLQHLQ